MVFQPLSMHAREALIMPLLTDACPDCSMAAGGLLLVAASTCGRGLLLPVPLHHPHTALKVGSKAGSFKHSPQDSTQPHGSNWQLNPDCFPRDKSFNNP